MSITLPSFYLSDLERKRQRSADLRGELDAADKQGIGGLDMLAKLKRQFDDDEIAKESKSHGRDIESRNQDRADAKAKLEDEGASLDNEKKRRALDAEGEPARQGKIHDALEMVRAQLGDEADDPIPNANPDDTGAENKGRSMKSGNILDKLREQIDEPLSPTAPSSNPDDDYKREHARLEKARADAQEKKNKGGSGPKGPPSAKERKLEAEAKIAESKAADLGKPKAPHGEAVDKVASVKEAQARVDELIANVTENGTGIEQQLRDIGGRLPIVGDEIDPGAKARTLFDDLEAFKSAELKRMSGSGVTEGERTAFARFNANIGSTTSTALAALHRYKADLERIAQARRDATAELTGAPAPSGSGVKRENAPPVAAKIDDIMGKW
jgi:hypothetical protein